MSKGEKETIPKQALANDLEKSINRLEGRLKTDFQAKREFLRGSITALKEIKRKWAN